MMVVLHSREDPGSTVLDVLEFLEVPARGPSVHFNSAALKA